MRNKLKKEGANSKDTHRILIKKDELRPLHPILTQWLGVQRAYIECVVPDLPFWYGERPQVGFLAAAAAKQGAITLEEWRTKRDGEHETSDGRNDLWFKYKGKQWIIEAKYVNLRLRDLIKKSGGETKLDDSMKLAKDQALRVHIENEPCRDSIYWLAITFAALKINSKKERRPLICVAQEWQNECEAASTKDGAIAILISTDKDRICEAYKRSEKTWTIGTAMFMRLVKKNEHPR